MHLDDGPAREEATIRCGHPGGGFTLRTTANPLVRAAGRGLARLNARHPWDHNAHFHPWILRSLPPGAQRVLDVGCGRGDLLAALRGRSEHLEGIDPDPGMAAAAAAALQEVPGAEVHRRTLVEHVQHPGTAAAYDAVTFVASLHHQQVPQALAQARHLLRPGGRLLVVTLVRPAGPADQLWDIADALTNPAIGLVKHPRPVQGAPVPARPGPVTPEVGEAEPSSAAMPVRDPDLTLAALREAARHLLPGARIRRREGFRVTLRWQRPG